MKILALMILATPAPLMSGTWIEADGTERLRTCPPAGRLAAAQVLPGGCVAPQPGVLLSPDRYAALVATEAAYDKALDEVRTCRADHLAAATDCAADVEAVVTTTCAPAPDCEHLKNGLLWCAGCAVASGLVWGATR